MQFQVTFKNMPYSDALSLLAQKKITHVISKYANKPTKIHAVFWVDKELHHGSVSIAAGDGMSLQSQAASTYMYTTLDQLVDKIERQLRKKKERLKEHKARPMHDWPEMSAEITAQVEGPTRNQEPLEAENVISYEKARQRYYRERLQEGQRAASPGRR